MKNAKFLRLLSGETDIIRFTMYFNYYAAEVNDKDDNPPIGLILTDFSLITSGY